MSGPERRGGEWRRRLGVHPLLAVGLLAAVVAFGTTRLLGAQAGGAVAGCSSAPVARSSFAALKTAVAGSGLGSLRAGGASDVQGVQDPPASWTDIPPAPTVRSPTAAVDEGYEIRWWSAALDHQAADLFVFSHSEEARRFVATAISAACHPHATTYQLAQPAGAHALTWTNPDNAREADVFFVRGQRAYRIVEVPPTTYQNGPFHLNDAELIGLAQLAACGLKQARCNRPQLRPALSVEGYVSLETLARAVGLLRFEPLLKAPSIFGHACVLMRGLTDPQARALYEGCQVSVHFFNVLSYAFGCYRNHPCQQWAINAAAADLRRTAGIMRQIAAYLIAGGCRDAWVRDASRDDRLGEAFVLYGRALIAHSRRASRQEAARAGALVEQAERIAVPMSEVLDTCAPHGHALGLPQIT